MSDDLRAKQMQRVVQALVDVQSNAVVELQKGADALLKVMKSRQEGQGNVPPAIEPGPLSLMEKIQVIQSDLDTPDETKADLGAKWGRLVGRKDLIGKVQDLTIDIRHQTRMEDENLVRRAVQDLAESGNQPGEILHKGLVAIDPWWA